jgi:YggT family protein
MHLVYNLVDLVLAIYVWLLFATAVLDWLVGFGAVDAKRPMVARIRRYLSFLVEPVLRLLRRILPALGGTDISPIVGIMLIMATRYAMALFILRNLP